MNFGQAIEALKNGKCVARHGWNGKHQFVFKQVPATIHKDIVAKMQSLPQSAKSLFEKTFNDKSAQIDAICYTDQLAIVGYSNTICSWSPSVADSLADDWYVVE